MVSNRFERFTSFQASGFAGGHDSWVVDEQERPGLIHNQTFRPRYKSLCRRATVTEGAPCECRDVSDLEGNRRGRRNDVDGCEVEFERSLEVGYDEGGVLVSRSRALEGQFSLEEPGRFDNRD